MKREMPQTVYVIRFYTGRLAATYIKPNPEEAARWYGAEAENCEIAEYGRVKRDD